MSNQDPSLSAKKLTIVCLSIWS